MISKILIIFILIAIIVLCAFSFGFVDVAKSESAIVTNMRTNLGNNNANLQRAISIDSDNCMMQLPYQFSYPCQDNIFPYTDEYLVKSVILPLSFHHPTIQQQLQLQQSSITNTIANPLVNNGTVVSLDGTGRCDLDSTSRNNTNKSTHGQNGNSAVNDPNNKTLSIFSDINDTTITVAPDKAVLSGSISGTVYIDSNLNKIKDISELGKANRKLKLSEVRSSDNTSITFKTAISATDGTYRFSKLELGTYTVNEADVLGWAHTTKADLNIIVGGSSPNVTGIDFGNAGLSRITAAPFDDANKNGIKDFGEQIESGRTITLSGTMSNGSAAKTKTQVITNSTSGTTFYKVYPGTYSLKEAEGSKTIFNIVAKDTGGTLFFDFGSSESGGIKGFVFNETNGNSKQGSSESGGIKGIVFNDTNGNLKQDTGEKGVANWNVTLLSKDGSTVVSTASTGQSGEGYMFSNILAGTYTVFADKRYPFVPTQPLNNSYAISIISDRNYTRNFGVFKNPVPLIGIGLNSDLHSFTVEGIALDSQGSLYDVDTVDHVVKKFDKSGKLVMSFGNTYLSRPGGIAIDSRKNILVSDQVRNNIQVFDVNGNFTKSIGEKGSSPGQFNSPRGLGIDSHDNLYVADGGNQRVQKLDKNGSYLMTVGSGKGGLPWSYLGLPFDVKVDSKGNIFVADTSNNRVQKFDINGNFLLNIGKSGIVPAIAGKDDGQFNKLRAITIGPNDSLYVTDTYNNRLQKFDNDGNFLLSFGQLGSGPGQFLNPSGIVVDRTTGVGYVADNGNGRIQVLDINGQFLSQFVTRLIPVEPYFSYIDDSRRLLVSDGANHKIQVFDPNTGYLLTQFGSIGIEPGKFRGPRGIATDSSGNIWVADNYNNRIQKLDSNGTPLLAVGTSGSGPGEFNQPRGLVIDESGNILVSDTQNNRIQKFDSNGKFLTSFTTPNMTQPYQIALDKEGNIYVAEGGSNHIEKLAKTTGKSLLVFGSKGTKPGQFILPRGVYVDTSGNIYTSDLNNRIQKFDSNGTLLLYFGTSGTAPGQLSNPRGILVDSSNNIWVDDTVNKRIQKFDNTGKLIKQISHSE